MARERLTFRQRDVAAAIRAAKKAGLTVSEVKISRDGQIVLITEEGAKKVKRSPVWDKLHENPPNVR
jgi:hypothetical protein